MLLHPAAHPERLPGLGVKGGMREPGHRGAGTLLTHPRHPKYAKFAILYSADLGVFHKGDVTLQKQWAETKSRSTSEHPARRFNTRAS